MSPRIRPLHLALLFGGFFGGIALAAYAYATTTTGAWFVGLPSFAVFLASMLGALVLLVGLALFVAVLSKFSRDTAPAPDAPALRARLAVLQAHLQKAEKENRKQSADSIDALLDSLADPRSPAPPAIDPDEAATGEEVTAVREELAAVQLALDAMKNEHARGQTERKTVLPTLAGPILAAVLFLGISAMMLPGIDGFSRSNYVLSNALILTISYSWIGLGAYAVTSMLLALRITAKTDGPTPRRAKGPLADPTLE